MFKTSDIELYSTVGWWIVKRPQNSDNSICDYDNCYGFITIVSITKSLHK